MPREQRNKNQLIPAKYQLSCDKLKRFLPALLTRNVLHEVGIRIRNKLRVSGPNRSLSQVAPSAHAIRDLLADDFSRFTASGLFTRQITAADFAPGTPGFEIDQIMDIADRIEAVNRIPIYSKTCVRYPTGGIDWHLDPLTEYRWPMDTTGYSGHGKKPPGTDIKTIWEVSRFQFLSPLAQAYQHTGDKRFLDKAIASIMSWIRVNPAGRGPHWLLPMESAIRLLNWCYAIPFFNSRTELPKDFLESAAVSLYEHMVFIRNNLERSVFKSNNHYLSNLVGLLPSRLIFPSLDDAGDCTDFAVAALFEEILSQFTPEGINFEGSLPYHRLSTEMVAVGLGIVSRLGCTVPEKVITRVRAIGEFTNFYTALCGETPVIGDNDSGVIIPFFPGQTGNDHRYLNRLLDLALSLSERDRPAGAKSPGAHTAPLRKKAPGQSPQVKEADGLVVASYNGSGFFFSCLKSCQGHVHNDKLSFYPVIDGKPLFVDRGTFSYTGEPEKRVIDRSGASHNAPVVNGWEQNRFWPQDPFYMANDARPGYRVRWFENRLIVTGWHTGYGRIQARIKVCRKIEWRFLERIWIIEDWIEAGSTIDNFTMSWCFLVDPAWHIAKTEGGAELAANGCRGIIRVPSNVEMSIMASSYCPGYQTEAPCTSFTGSATVIPGKRITFIVGY